jgi:hypothetical protein
MFRSDGIGLLIHGTPKFIFRDFFRRQPFGK